MILLGDLKGYLLTFGMIFNDDRRFNSNLKHALEMIFRSQNRYLDLVIDRVRNPKWFYLETPWGNYWSSAWLSMMIKDSTPSSFWHFYSELSRPMKWLEIDIHCLFLLCVYHAKYITFSLFTFLSAWECLRFFSASWYLTQFLLSPNADKTKKIDLNQRLYNIVAGKIGS